MTLSNNQGSIDVTLPQNSSFHIDAVTTSGSITSDDVRIKISAGSKEVHTDVGTPPYNTLLSLNTNAGTIALHMQKGT